MLIPDRGPLFLLSFLSTESRTEFSAWYMIQATQGIFADNDGDNYFIQQTIMPSLIKKHQTP